MQSIIQMTESGFYCERGGFYIDPWRPVNRAVITHAHADHARVGSQHYLTTTSGEAVARTRLGRDAVIQAIPYGETVSINGVKVSLHPAGHILGSAQVRVESEGEIWVISGDYKVGPDNTCQSFEPVRCHTFVTESTFGLPIYRWRDQSEIYAEINDWWRANAEMGKTSLLFGYSLGKAQRMLAGVDSSIGPILTHGAVEKLNRAYRESGVTLPHTRYARDVPKADWSNALVVAPPSAHGTPWSRKFAPSSSAFASGWMTIRGTRRRKAVDRGFVMSDHADWPGLLWAVTETGAERVLATHGYSAVLARWLTDHGVEGSTVETHFGGEEEDVPAEDDQNT